MVGCGEGVVYLTSKGRPTDTGLQLEKPIILVAGKGRGGMFLFQLFLHFHSCFFPVRLFHPLYYVFYCFLPFSGRWHKMTHKGWRVIKPQQNQSIWLGVFTVVFLFQSISMQTTKTLARLCRFWFKKAVFSFWRTNVHMYSRLTVQRTKPAQERRGQANWWARHDLNSVDWAVNLHSLDQYNQAERCVNPCPAEPGYTLHLQTV